MPLILGTSRDDESPEDGLGALSIREVVESALEQEDIMPVVSYFQTVNGTHAAFQSDRPCPRVQLCLDWSVPHHNLKRP